MHLSPYLEAAWLNHITGNGVFTPPTNVYLALFDGTDTELTGGSYVRQAVSFGTAASRAIANDALVAFTDLPAATVAAGKLMDAATAGNVLASGDLATAQAVSAGDPMEFAVGEVSVTVVAGGPSDAQALEFLDHTFGGVSYTPPTSLEGALIAGGSEAGGFTRPTLSFGAATGSNPSTVTLDTLAAWTDASTEVTTTTVRVFEDAAAGGAAVWDITVPSVTVAAGSGVEAGVGDLSLSFN